MKYIYYITIAHKLRDEIESVTGHEVPRDTPITAIEGIREIEAMLQEQEVFSKVSVTGIFLLRTEDGD